jgi:hypothetical protein
VTALPAHGPLDCTKCFADCTRPQKTNGWQLVNDPGYWGAADPRMLVLGQSKGMKARRVYARGEPAFDAVAFAGIRDRLAEVLASIGISLDKTNATATPTVAISIGIAKPCG